MLDVSVRMDSLGPVDMGTVQKVEVSISDEDKRRKDLFNSRPPLEEILNLHDFEVCVTPPLHLSRSFPSLVTVQLMGILLLLCSDYRVWRWRMV